MQFRPGAFQPTTAKPVGKRRTGLVPMAPGSSHMITIRPASGPAQQLQTTARPFETAPDGAKVTCVCLGNGCEKESWPNEAAMRRAHDAAEMDRRQIAHVWGLWSNDPTGAKDPACKACKESKDAPCPEHHGGCVGLIAPAAPLSDN